MVDRIGGMIPSPLAVLLVVSCALAFSGADISRKLLAAWMRPVPILFALSAGMTPFFLGWHLWQGGVGPAASYWLPGCTSTVINVAANLAFLEALRRSPLSLTIPLLSLTPVFTTLLAIPLLGEMPELGQWLGIAAVVIGAFWLNTVPGKAPLTRVWRAFRLESGARLMVGVALLWSLAMPLDKLAVTAASPAFHGVVLGAGVATSLFVVALVRGRLSQFAELRHRPGLVLFAVLISVVALALQLLAIRLVWVGLVETIKRGLGSFLALVWGRLIFDEPFESRRWLAVLVMGLGVAAVLL